MSRVRALLTAVIVAGGLVALPERTEARVTVTVEFAYGAVAVGGVSFLVYISGTWDLALHERPLPTALVEVCGDRARWGLPLPAPRLAGGDAGAGEARGVQVDLLRFRF